MTNTPQCPKCGFKEGHNIDCPARPAREATNCSFCGHGNRLNGEIVHASDCQRQKLTADELDSWLGLVQIFGSKHILLHGAAGEDAMNIGDLENILVRAKALLSAIPNTPDEDAERYRWFRNECSWLRRSDIVDVAAEEPDMLDHHIDKGRCGL